MQLFTITVNGTVHDYTKNIVVPSYSVTNKEVFESWTDGNGIERRENYRDRTSGSFKMLFETFDDYLSFLSVLENVKATEGYYSVALYLNNKNAVETCNVFMDFTPVLNPKGFGNLEVFDITVAER